ncbi:hypothetical protein [Thermoflexus sp.]|uniref:hypothetical protein n=1 Tax=Thermoflexus sp. TaxID=1969742 RepID=UPI002ADD3942|nr:hypothetical protein [Thermoflexus sp.]
MRNLSHEDQEALRAILRKRFEEATVEALLEALDRLATRQEEKATDLRQLVETLEAAVRGVRENVRQLADSYQHVVQGLARLAEIQARTIEGLSRLTEAHARIENALTRLAEVQVKAEERLAHLEETVARLAEAQAKAEERLARLEETVARLAEAQAKAEERLARLEETVARLAEAQAKTEERLARLEQTIERLARQVGGLSDLIGGDLEDTAYIVIHDSFERELGWEVDVLERAFLRWDDRELEIDIFGKAFDPNRPKHEIWIVGETKYNITISEVDRFAQKLGMVEEYLKWERGEKGERLIIPVIFCYRARPEVQQKIHDLGFHLVFSYGRIRWGKEGPPISGRKRAPSRKTRR